MLGFITDADLEAADEEFPGIAGFFARLAEKPRTFLDLVAEFDHGRGGKAVPDLTVRARAAS